MAITQPTTDIEVISNAAVICGKQPFNAIDSGGSFSYAADRLYQNVVTAELGSNRWRFAQATQSISALTTLTPQFDSWQYYFELPADLLMMTRIDPFVKYQLFGDRVLLTGNTTPLQVIYTKSVPVSKWPPAFAMYIVYELASMLALSVTNSDRMVARIEQKRDKWESRALFADSQSSPARQLRSQPYITARYAGSSNRYGRR